MNDETQQKHGLMSKMLLWTAYVVMAVAFVCFIYIEFHGVNSQAFPFNTRDSVLLGRDFLNSYNMSLFGQSGILAAYYDPTKYMAFLSHTYGAGLTVHLLSYPPHLAVFLWPLAFAPYTIALLVWTVGGFVSLGLALRLTGLKAKGWLAFLMPATVMCIIAGQIGLYVAALSIAGFLLRQTRPVISGILFGLLTVKPQLGLLIPFLLLYERNWRAILAAAMTTALLLGISLSCTGLAAWRSFFEFVPASQHIVLTQWSGVMLAMMPTAYINARLIGMDHLAGLVQGISLISSASLLIWGFVKKIDPDWLFLAFCITTTTISPYFFSYDLIALGVAALILIERKKTANPMDMLIVSSAMIFPVITFALATAKLPLSALLLLLMLAGCVFRKKGAEPAPSDYLMNNSGPVTIA
jgi:alpha-1,2-mannosyltransferase